MSFLQFKVWIDELIYKYQYNRLVKVLSVFNNDMHDYEKLEILDKICNKYKKPLSKKFKLPKNCNIPDLTKYFDELKPCPCCGSHHVNIEMYPILCFYRWEGEYGCTIRCEKCGLQLVDNYSTYIENIEEIPKDLIKIWNKRK